MLNSHKCWGEAEFGSASKLGMPRNSEFAGKPLYTMSGKIQKMLSPSDAPSSKKTRPSKKHWKPQASPALETNLPKASDHCHTAGPQPSFGVGGLGARTPPSMTQNKSTGSSFVISVDIHKQRHHARDALRISANYGEACVCGSISCGLCLSGATCCTNGMSTPKNKKPLGTEVCKFSNWGSTSFNSSLT